MDPFQRLGVQPCFTHCNTQEWQLCCVMETPIPIRPHSIPVSRALGSPLGRSRLPKFMRAHSDTNLIAALSKSQIYQDFERAFGETTGLPLNLRPVDHWQLAHRGRKHENPFCALMAQSNKSCAACLRMQQEISDPGIRETRSGVCFAGLCETSVPLRVGDHLIGFLQTGEVMFRAPQKGGFSKIAEQLREWGFSIDLTEAEAAWLRTRTLSKKQYNQMIRLLEIFAQHLALVANQLMIRQQKAEPPAITRARQYIEAHYTEELPLGKVAQAVNMSSYYFCKMFRRATGVTFTDYLSRVRIEKAKSLLLNPNARVSEIAFDTGFASITNFNRTFKQFVGHSPTDYRDTLPNVA